MIGYRAGTGLIVLLALASPRVEAVNHTVTFVCCAYTPNTLTIDVGDSVTWSGAFASHPLLQVQGPQSDDATPGGFAASSGTTLVQTFNTGGTFYYECTFHGVAAFQGTMRGVIIVRDILYANDFE